MKKPLLQKLGLQKKQTSTEKLLIQLQKYGIYVAFFLAGYILAKVQTLFTLS